jgi:hypothetical protein
MLEIMFALLLTMGSAASGPVPGTVLTAGTTTQKPAPPPNPCCNNCCSTAGYLKSSSR